MAYLAVAVKRVTVWARRWLKHTRFVPTHLYRLLLLAALVSSVLQLVYGAPASVQSATGAAIWMDWMFVGLQLAGSVLALWGLYLVNDNAAHATHLARSLLLELLGLIMLQTSIAVGLVAAVDYQGRVPSALATWLVFTFWVWSFLRDRDIWFAMRALNRAPRWGGPGRDAH